MTYRRRQPYNTVSNKVRTIRTPGGEHRLLNTKKKGTNPKCGDCGSKLAGSCITEPLPISITGTTAGSVAGLASRMLIHTAIQIPALRPREYAQISRPKKTVSRSYGGSRCATCVKDRVTRAFLIEEQKIVKKVMREAEKKNRR
ncbi:hypothetical protein D0867_02937 [Hortaea werneckii]|uniref:60S ribosomal protein L34 n=1 Tax=Hortaea werneckii TaxID=91943 RepID=A0A3M7A4A1_HORWE|nr:hypothetical protein D0867_02937 [Hortaea werneckii]